MFFKKLKKKAETNWYLMVGIAIFVALILFIILFLKGQSGNQSGLIDNLPGIG